MEDGRENPAAIRAMTFNIRVDHAEDRNTENEWQYRLEKVTHVVNKYKPDILALQEPISAQLDDLKKSLGANYSWISAPSSDHDPLSEVVAIAYKNERFDLKKSGRFWLAPDPTQEPGSPAWDGSSYPRVAAYGTLEDKKTEKVFSIFNAHFDHKGSEARINSAKLMGSKASELSDQTPYLIMGDFNTFPNDRGLEAYEALKDHKDVIDAREIAGKRYGPDNTWIGWDYSPWNLKKMQQRFPDSPFRLDHIFLSRAGFRVDRTAVVDDRFKIKWENEKKEVYPSDHRPVIADFLVEQLVASTSVY